MHYRDIVDRLKHVSSTPPRPIPAEAVSRIREEYYRKNPGSARLFEEAKQIIPGGLQHNLSSDMPFPVTIERAGGCRLWDVDGNAYVDYLLCGGPVILGHSFAPLDRAVARVVEEAGPASGLACRYEYLAAREIIRHMPGVEMVRFLQTATEACMAAIRMARAYTGREMIIKIGGSYHGWSDQLVYSLYLPGTALLNARGIPGDCFNRLLDIPPNDFDRLQAAFAEHKGNIAGVIVEPVGGESGMHPVHPRWNEAIRELCDRHRSLLIFDETVTGFRLDLGGAQKVIGITPDLTVLGKLLTHGYPSAGAVGGKKEVMEVLAGGLGNRVYVGGTLAANPISSAACYHALRLMEEHGAVEKAADYAGRLTAALNSLFETRPDLPFFAYNFGPIVHYVTTLSLVLVDPSDPDVFFEVIRRRKQAEEFQMVLMAKGINTLKGARMYTCMQHGPEDLDQTVTAWEELLSLIPED